MNDEIKEKMTIGKAKKILRGFLAKDCYYDTPLYYAIPYLLDYITNLQQENLSLAKENEQEKQFIKDCGFENVQQLVLDYIGIRQEKEDYKSKNKKAVEYINNYFVLGAGSEYKRKLTDILNGRSDE